MSTQALTTVVVVTWRGVPHLNACLDALSAQVTMQGTPLPHQVMVIDNSSQDGTQEILSSYQKREHQQKQAVGFVVHRLNRNLGYAGALDFALPLIETPLMAWLNDDTAPSPHWLSALENTLASNPHAAAVSSRLIQRDGSTQSVGVRLTEDGHGADLTEAGSDNEAGSDKKPVFGFCGGAALLRTEALRAISGIPRDFFCYYEDTDTSWRLRLAGWQILAEPKAEVLHKHGQSTNLNSRRFHRWNERNRLLMLIRCAPTTVAIAQLAHFAALTAILPFRRQKSRERSMTREQLPLNFRFFLRARVLAEILLRLPGALGKRRAISTQAKLARGDIWRDWAGH